jgi:DNA recombination protein RmuC
MPVALVALISCVLALAAGVALFAALRLRARLADSTAALEAHSAALHAESAARAQAVSSAALSQQARLAAEDQLARARAESELARREAAGLSDALSTSRSERAAVTATLQARTQQVAELESRAGALKAELAEARAAVHQELRIRTDAESQLGRLEALLSSERAQAGEKQALLQQAEQRLTDTFQAISGRALEQNSAQLLQLAEARFAQLHEGAKGDLAQRQQAIDQLVGPMRAELEKVGGKLQEFESVRLRDSSTLAETLRSLAGTQEALKGETQRLVAALRAPQTRGRWAEVHLRRVVELAGLQEHCDFVEQVTVTSEEGTLRPDLVVKLPGGSQVVIDAKAPLLAWLEANEAGGPLVLEDAGRRELYRNHARQVRAHVGSLADKAYWSQFDKAPDFVVLFLPTEAILGAALEADPELHEYAITRHVLLATPMTLIALLRTVAYGWRQDALAENAREISEQGGILYERLAVMAENFAALGRKLRGAVESFNDTVGSLERRVLPAARRLKECKAVAEEVEIPLPLAIDAVPRAIQSPELIAAALPEEAN